MSTSVRKRFSGGAARATARISLRVESRTKAALVRAAKLQQLKLTEFIINSSHAAAESALADRTRFILPPKKWRQFNAALDTPTRRIPELRKLFVDASATPK